MSLDYLTADQHGQLFGEFPGPAFDFCSVDQNQVSDLSQVALR